MISTIEAVKGGMKVTVLHASMVYPEWHYKIEFLEA